MSNLHILRNQRTLNPPIELVLYYNLITSLILISFQIGITLGLTSNESTDSCMMICNNNQSQVETENEI